MKNTLAVIVLACLSGLSISLAAQSRAPHTQAFAAAGHTDLNSTLINLDHVSQAMQTDIARLGVEKWRSGWKTGFLKGSSHKEQAQQAAGSLQRNLANALPGLMQDVQSSRGGIAATFRLYDDVSLVCETLDSLITASEAASKKGDAAPLVDDYSALTRIRRSLSSYIQQSASTWETKGRMPVTSFSTPASQPSRMAGSPAVPAARPVRQISSSSTQVVMTDQGVKKIIIDDTVPEKKSAAPAPKKKPATTYSNQE